VTSSAAGAKQSRAAFARQFPEIMKRLERSGTSGASVVREEGVPVDLRLDGRLVYDRDAQRFAAEQVEGFMKKPLRFFMHRLDMSGIVTPVGRRLVRAIEDDLRSDHCAELTSHPVASPTFLIVLGMGLGHHLDVLTERTEARWLILVEPLLAFFEASFEVVDWAKLIAEYEGRGGGIRIVAEADPHRIVGGVIGFIGAKGVPYADGSWVFTHYPFWSFAEARRRLHEAMEFTFINRGFFEDELVMLRNAVHNFAACDFRLLEGRPRLRRPETAVVVGSGPSLDIGIETLRRIRDRVVIFSGGTALRALLSQGIVPDFHCELENVPGVHDVLVETAKIGALSGITLLASTTVDPRVPALFRDTIFYFRDSISSTQILGGKHRIIEGTSPTCVNLALGAAAVMGFTEIALFGTDCGMRPGSLRHAKGTVYSEVGIYEAGNRSQSPAMQVEGNFGGVVETEIIYDACRLMLGDAIRHYRLNVLNCSDGALIPGAQPRVPEALEVPATPVDGAAVRAEVERGMPSYPRGKMLDEADFGAVRARTHEMFAALDAILAALGEGKPDFGTVYDRMVAFIAEAKDRYGRTESIVVGSLQALPRIAMFYGFRVPAATRPRIFALFIAEFRAIVAEMSKEVFALFDELEALAPAPARLARNG